MAEESGPTLRRAFERAVAYRERAAAVPPRPTASLAELRGLFDIGLPAEGRDGVEIIETLADAGEQGLIGITSPQFFGWVMGASHPVGVAAEFLAAAWGQNAATYQTAPAAAVAEEIASDWLLELLDLPRQSSVGFTTGATMASFICLSAARTDVLFKAGWDLEEEGLTSAPEVHVFLGEEAHATIHSGLRYLGFGERQKIQIVVDDQGRMCPDDLERKLMTKRGPKIVIAQAGHINSGAFDPLPAIAKLAQVHEAWLHVDGAFGLWVRSVPAMAGLCAGAEAADSWSTDGHKWLQVPYDSGFAIVKNEIAHKRAMDTSASYITASADDGRSPSQFGPELSRRARGFAVWATIQALGRRGIEEMLIRHTQCAKHLRDFLANEPGIEVLNEVVINQVAVGFGEEDEPDIFRDDHVRRVIDEIWQENTSYVGGATWKGRGILRVSTISRTTEIADIEQLGSSIIRAWRRVRGRE
ncbi:MAG: aspartate aminotransferase family protein [Deltaproteobacteria bacterium]|nr:aspartate aminotransferase family protein [Deltaproteobacteria bacterium]